MVRYDRGRHLGSRLLGRVFNGVGQPGGLTRRARRMTSATPSDFAAWLGLVPQSDLDHRPHGVITAIWGARSQNSFLGRSQRFLRTSGFLQSDISDGEVCWGGGRSHRACSA